MDLYISQVTQLLQHLKIDKANIVGFSMGMNIFAILNLTVRQVGE